MIKTSHLIALSALGILLAGCVSLGGSTAEPANDSVLLSASDPSTAEVEDEATAEVEDEATAEVEDEATDRDASSGDAHRNGVAFPGFRVGTFPISFLF